MTAGAPRPPSGRRRSVTRRRRASARVVGSVIHHSSSPTSSWSLSCRGPARSRSANSSISRRTPGSPRPSPPYVLKPSPRARSMSGMPGPPSRATIWMPRRGVVEQLDHDLARAREPDDVAAYLGHRRRDDREVGGAEGETRRELACGAARGDDVGVRRDGYAQAVVTLLTAFRAAAGSAARTARTRGGAGRRAPRAGAAGRRCSAR